MIDEFLKQSLKLRERREAYAHAIVVRHGKPISSKPGDKAIICRDGTMHGWIGGGCTHPVVVKEALQALQEGEPRLVAITPSGAVQPIRDFAQHPMTCHSGGALDIYIEPVLPNPLVVVMGHSPVGQSLARLVQEVGYSVAVSKSLKLEGTEQTFPEHDLSGLALAEPCFIVVSTQGEDDELALQAALQTDVGYVAFVGSKKKAEALKEYLQREGIPEDRLNALRTPAGLDLQARTPGEIAVSILAEIVQIHRNPTSGFAESDTPKGAVDSQEAVDPVCGMAVAINSVKHVAKHEGRTFYFCCAGCRIRFEAEPERYLASIP